ncbi:hypothetical protein [Bacillus thuringiensis]|uniref:hypothetical protein n=1 Tax=Bacillus thuringiensis TaxID=1428 RepID=UPI0021D66D00|nr:hypothetical protein [Bacillus thuringiensis]MCU7667720.1 hypothetical protein [Bacillus thuringiensis]
MKNVLGIFMLFFMFIAAAGFCYLDNKHRDITGMVVNNFLTLSFIIGCVITLMKASDELKKEIEEAESSY